LWHVLEHVHELHQYAEQLKNLLSSDGKLFIAVPNYTSKDAKIYQQYWAAYDVPRHLYHFSPAAMKIFFTFLMQKITPFPANNLKFGNVEIVLKDLHKIFRTQKTSDAIINLKTTFHTAIRQQVLSIHCIIK
ncbi:MAG: methyltransferase domain-containing protein, partial [Ginsengibacter sp.]